ncbi:MAG TPA: acetylglutamate kinase [Gemmatimonadaceae bacterium]
MMRVIKVGGRAQDDSRLAPAIAAAWKAAPAGLCLVHGGGDGISALQRALGVEPSFALGRRVTGERDIEAVRMALSGTANKLLVARLVSAGVSALGISGEDAGLIVARAVSPGTLGRVGTPERIEVRLLWHLLDGGYLPVISPLSRDIDTPECGALNVNGDDAAAAIAVALGASELLFVADVAGVMANGEVVSSLAPDDAAAMIERGVATGGMAAKLQAAATALDGGVECVRIGDMEAILDPSLGTALVPSRSFA